MPESTPEAKKLYEALIKRRIGCTLEYYWEGIHIDISIPWAELNIEVDGLQHYTDPRQMLADIARDFSFRNELRRFPVIRIPNYLVRNNCEQVADCIAEVARQLNKKKQQSKEMFENSNGNEFLKWYNELQSKISKK